MSSATGGASGLPSTNQRMYMPLPPTTMGTLLRCVHTRPAAVSACVSAPAVGTGGSGRPTWKRRSSGRLAEGGKLAWMREGRATVVGAGSVKAAARDEKVVVVAAGGSSGRTNPWAGGPAAPAVCTADGSAYLDDVSGDLPRRVAPVPGVEALAGRQEVQQVVRDTCECEPSASVAEGGCNRCWCWH